MLSFVWITLSTVTCRVYYCTMLSVFIISYLLRFPSVIHLKSRRDGQALVWAEPEHFIFVCIGFPTQFSQHHPLFSSGWLLGWTMLCFLQQFLWAITDHAACSFVVALGLDHIRVQRNLAPKHSQLIQKCSHTHTRLNCISPTWGCSNNITVLQNSVKSVTNFITLTKRFQSFQTR